MINLYEKVKSVQNERRYAHTLGVIEVAKQIAAVYNLDVIKCETAALLHDITKQFSKEEQEKLLANVDDKFILDNVALWHSYSGAIYVQDYLNIDDSQIIEAIKYHTIGKKDCSLIAKVIYISDYIEPNRTLSNLDKHRDNIGNVSLDVLFNNIAKERIEYELSQGHNIHPITKELYESII